LMHYGFPYGGNQRFAHLPRRCIEFDIHIASLE
jgi:hypothetical protein